MIGAPANATSTSDEAQLPQAGQAKLEAYGLALSQLYAKDGDRPSAAAPARASASGTNASESVPRAAGGPLPEAAGLQEVLEGERPVQQSNITLEGGHVGGGMLTKCEVDSQKMNMLLAHPVVVKAMQNPNLDAILSRMLGICRLFLRQLHVACHVEFASVVSHAVCPLESCINLLQNLTVCLH